MSEDIRDLVSNAIQRDNAGWQQRVDATALKIPGMDYTQGQQSVPFEGPAATSASIKLQETWPAQPSVIRAVVPFNVTARLVSGVLKATVTPGYVDGNIPTIGGVSITDLPAPTLTLTGIGIEIVALKLKLNLQTANGYVYGASFDYTSIAVAGSLPADNLVTGEYYVLLATFISGVKQTPQPVLVNLSYYIQDDQTGTSQANCLFIGA